MEHFFCPFLVLSGYGCLTIRVSSLFSKNPSQNGPCVEVGIVLPLINKRQSKNASDKPSYG